MRPVKRPSIREEAIGEESGTAKRETREAHTKNSRAKWIREGDALQCCFCYRVGQVSDRDHDEDCCRR